MRRAAALVPDWSGGTRLGDTLKDFLDRWGAGGCARGAVVVVLSDGWERDGGQVLGAQMGRLGLLADRVVAMSPRPGRIAKIVDIELPRPRTIDMEFTAQFKSYSDQIRAVIYHGAGVGKR